MPTAIVDTQTNEFETFGHAEDARWVKVTLPRNPDPAVERFNGNLANPAIVLKSAPELAATATAADAAQLNAQFARGLQAVAAALFKDRTGAFPTPAQKATLKADFWTAWKALAP
jgi:hypothetical protein